MTEDRAENIAGQNIEHTEQKGADESARGRRMRELRTRTLRHREHGTVPPEREGEAEEHWDEIGTDRANAPDRSARPAKDDRAEH